MIKIFSRLFNKKSRFLDRFGLPFIIIMLAGIVVYLASVIGTYESEKKSIQALIENSDPKGFFSLPENVNSRRWGTFGFDSLNVSFRYPLNWRPAQSEGHTIIREGEAAIITGEMVDTRVHGESMIAYRVARISALMDLKYIVESISETEISGTNALVLYYHDTEGKNDFYETTFIHEDMFYSLLLVIKNERTSAGNNNAVILDEYKKILATISIL
jgi:hypothetical protein